MKTSALLILSLLCCLPTQVGMADPLLPINFSLFATHPDAANQPTTRGKTIRDIHAFEGQLYTAYGDWAQDYGPIEVRTLDPDSAQWSGSKLSFQTEAISHFRGLNGALYTTKLDPINETPPAGSAEQPAGYAIGSSSHMWSAVVPNISGTSDPLTAFHVFDINATSNGDLYMAGSLYDYGMVWRSVDGGATFTVEQQTPPAPGSPDIAFSRYVGVAVYQDEVYVQRVDFNVGGAHNSQSLKFDGTNWTNGPDLISQADGYMARPEQFGDRLVYLSSDLSNGYLYSFDGTSSQHVLSDVVHDFQIVGNSIIALTSGGELLFSNDLALWTSLGFAPTDSRSFEIVGDTIFVGTTGAEIYAASGFDSLQGVPEPGAGILFISLLGCICRFRRR